MQVSAVHRAGGRARRRAGLGTVGADGHGGRRAEVSGMSDTGNGDFEFERRFVARDVPPDLLETAPALIVQSYYLADGGYALRVRAQASSVPGVDLSLDEVALLERYADDVDFCAVTVKGPMNGGTRYEVERELDPIVGVEMVRRGGARVAKARHSVWLGEDGWVVDVFAGANAPLVVAEVERGGPVTDLAIPDFCVTEVTTDARFANDGLAHRPFGAWAEQWRAELARTGPRFLPGFGHDHPMTGI